MATEIQRRTTEQLCRTLGELKGGAPKLRQALSVLARRRCRACLPHPPGPARQTPRS